MAKHYQKTEIRAGDGRRRVIVTVECIDDARTLVSDEFKHFHKSAADNVMDALRGVRNFKPHLSDIDVQNKR